MLAQSMRPKFKADTYCVPMSNGVYLRGNNSCLMLKGKSLYFLLKNLILNLDGTVTLAEITEGLDADRKRMITKLLEKLFTHKFLKDTSQDQSHTLSPVDLEAYAPDITFIESFQTSAAYRFECFQNKQLLIIGSGPSFASLIQASLQCGVRRINAIRTLEDEISLSSLQEIRDLFADYASGQTVQLIDSPSWDNEVEIRKTIQAYDAILHIAERPMLARAQLLNRLCVEQQKTFIQAIVVEDHVWIGPLVCPETSTCWECAWRRLQANMTHSSEQMSHYKFRDQPLIAGSQFLARPEAAIIANRLIFRLFQYFTHTCPTGTIGTLSLIDLKTDLNESHAFFSHPHCLACQHPIAPTASQFLERIQQLQHQDMIEHKRFLEDFAACVDDKLGLFAALDDHFIQVPLAVYRVHLSNPMPKKLQSEALSVIAVSTDVEDARMRAMQKACTRYAATLVDRRRLLSAEAIQQNFFPVISPDQLIGMQTLPPEDEMWTWALDLQMKQIYLIPQVQVSSDFCDQERGIASGKTWEEAVCQALLDWCSYFTVRQLKDAQQAYPQVDLIKTPMTPEGIHLYRLLKAVNKPVTVYDITGSLQVPTFATCLGEKVVAYSTHCDSAQALSIGLEQALQQYQFQQFQQLDHVVAPVPDFPSALRGDQLSVPCYIMPDAWQARIEMLLQKLQYNGLQAFAIPLDHDPALVQVLPFIVRVCVSRRELKEGE